MEGGYRKFVEKLIPNGANILMCMTGWDWEQEGICEKCTFFYEEQRYGDEAYVVTCQVEEG